MNADLDRWETCDERALTWPEFAPVKWVGQTEINKVVGESWNDLTSAPDLTWIGSSKVGQCNRNW